jgi:FHA domain
MNLFSSGCVLFDCTEGVYRIVEKTPFKIGSGGDCDWRIDDPWVAAEHCVIQRKSNVYYLLSSAGTDGVLLDGMLSPGGQLTPNVDHTLIVGNRLFALRVGSGLDKWSAGMNSNEWFVYDKAASSKFGPVSFPELAMEWPRVVSDVGNAVFLCRGLTSMGFYAEHVLPLIPPPLPKQEPPPLRPPESQDETLAIDTEYGEFTCPVCWLKFDRGDTMNVAVHAFLRGDPILGEAHMQRFHATRFNDRGQAVDAMNIPSPDLACPHCRRKLPPGFLDAPHLIFSIVGAPSSGKSYYLSVLVKVLQSTLFQQFGVTFRDADPSENVILNQMKIQLFSASTPQEAVLAKTELEGAMYETLPRLGRQVRLPKPFIFNLSSKEDHSQDFSVVFYDNAGEHFEPTRNSADSPGAQHIAAASGIFFLFDPLHNTEFRRRLTGLDDPQMDSRRVDQQDIILAETEVRIKSIMGLDSRQRISTPLAIIVGKSDTWLHLLGDQEIQWPVADGRLNVQIVQQNSDFVRKLLLDLCPAIVANAEAISSEIMYFAASPLGCSPVEFADSRGNRMIGPDPQKLDPQHVEVPTLWVLSRVVPSMVPSDEVKI